MGFLTLTTFNSCVVNRNVFDRFLDAKQFADTESKEKIVRKGDVTFFGDFKILVYDFNIPATSTQLDIPVYVA
jgi:hypothetical protein